MGNVRRKLTIFEGCDGSGKSTAAKAFAEASGAKYVHFAALPRVNSGLARMYVEAMLPALLGYQDVVFDRCWMSETPYGVAFREGHDRLGEPTKRMLERLAMRCGAVVVRCNPGWEAIERSYRSRKHLEMLDNVDQLAQVFEMYTREFTSLPEIHFDYTFGHGQVSSTAVNNARFTPHPVGVVSAGNWDANTVLVGGPLPERKDTDSFYQWPYASFNRAGGSQWLAHQLDHHGISEAELLWVDSAQDLSFIHALAPGSVIALDDIAYRKLYELKIVATAVVSPQLHKRFGGRQRYPLIDLLQE